MPDVKKAGSSMSSTMTGDVMTYHSPSTTLALFKPREVKINGAIRKMITTKIDVKAFKSIYDQITPKEITDLASSLSSVTETEIRSLIGSLFDFMGFDPEIVMRVLVAINKTYAALPLDPPETPETLKEDIMLAVGCTIRLGNLQFAAAQRRSEEGKAVIGYLISKYGILVGSTGAGMPSTALTFPRIANTFPVLTVRSAIVLGVQDNQQNEFKANVLPAFMRVSAFVSFLGSDLEDRTADFIRRAACAFSCDYQRTVHEGNILKYKLKKADNIFTAEDAWNAQVPYFIAIMGSKVPGPKMKRAMLVELKMSKWYEQVLHVNKKITEVLDDKFLCPTEDEYSRDLNNYINSSTPAAIKDAAESSKKPTVQED
jgi:hypothetical protein